MVTLLVLIQYRVACWKLDYSWIRYHMIGFNYSWVHINIQQRKSPFFCWFVDEVATTTETHTLVPSSNPSQDVQPNNFGIAN